MDRFEDGWHILTAGLPDNHFLPISQRDHLGRIRRHRVLGWAQYRFKFQVNCHISLLNQSLRAFFAKQSRFASSAKRAQLFQVDLAQLIDTFHMLGVASIAKFGFGQFGFHLH